MAANYARRTLLSSSSSASAAKLAGFASVKPTTSEQVCRNKLPCFSRPPVELGCAQSLMPLHSDTASALLTWMLFVEVWKLGMAFRG